MYRTSFCIGSHVPLQGKEVLLSVSFLLSGGELGSKMRQTKINFDEKRPRIRCEHTLFLVRVDILVNVEESLADPIVGQMTDLLVLSTFAEQDFPPPTQVVHHMHLGYHGYNAMVATYHGYNLV